MATDRYTNVTFSVGPIPAGETWFFAVAIPNSIVNVAKLKVVPSVAAITSQFKVYKNSSHADSKIVYATKEYTGTLVDPVQDDGTTVSERNQGFVCAYEDEAQTQSLYYSIKNAGGVSCSYTGTITVDPTYGHIGSGIDTGAPEDLVATAYAQYLTIFSAVEAKKFNNTIDQAEFRAIFVPTTETAKPYYDLRLESEGGDGSFVPNGTTMLNVTGIPATFEGAQYVFVSDSQGTWYYAWRLHNSIGWSHWTDGNGYPIRVTQRIQTRNNTADTGPPSDWGVVLSDGPASNTLLVRATRPKVNGDVINHFVVQIKDANTGAWTTLLDGPDVDNVRFDGRLVPASINASRNILTFPGGTDLTSVKLGDLVVLDVRGGTWEELHSQWGVVKYIGTNALWISGYFNPRSLSDLRVIVIKPPWAWTTGGYLGGYSGHGFWPQQKRDENRFIGDTKTQEFSTTAIIIPSDITQPEARVWFENGYSRSDDSLNHSEGMIGLPTQMTWNKFNDSRWWVPKYAYPIWANHIFNSDGSMNISAVTPRPSVSVGHFYGVQGHFTVCPDPDGVIIMRCKWTNVSIPQYAGTDTSEYTLLVMTSWNDWGYWSNACPWFTGWGNHAKDATVRFGQGYIPLPNPQSYPPNYSYLGGSPPPVGYLDIIRPAPGYTIEMRVGFSSGVGGSIAEMGLTTCEYSLNGGVWTAVPSIARGDQSIFIRNVTVKGIVPFIGLYEPYHASGQSLSNYSAKLTEFEVEQGIIRQFRLV